MKRACESCAVAAPPWRQQLSLLIFERVIGDGAGQRSEKEADVHMHVVLGGKERTRGEFAQLLDASGFVLERVDRDHDHQSDRRRPARLGQPCQPPGNSLAREMGGKRADENADMPCGSRRGGWMLVLPMQRRPRDDRVLRIEGVRRRVPATHDQRGRSRFIAKYHIPAEYSGGNPTDQIARMVAGEGKSPVGCLHQR